MKLVVGVSNVLVPAPLARTGVLARPCIAFRFGRSGPMPAGMPQSLAVRCDTSTATPKKRQVAKKEKVPPLPTPQAHQQTLARSFTIGGVGLHTGEYAFVCVRPALAGEGRYFVRVPRGTNADDYTVEAPQRMSADALDITAGADDGLDGFTRAQLFLQFREAQETEGFKGEFGDYITQELGDINSAHMEAVAPPSPADALVGRGPDEDWVPATVDAADVYMGAATMLSGEGGLEVLSPEALLSALEACGVDNARIEIEGGWEVPVVDGSSLGWVIAVQKAGVCEAAAGGDAQRAQRVAPNPQEMLTVRDGDAFVSFYPGEPAKVTAGVDHAGEADIIGRQWYTWGPGDSVPEDNYDNHYRWEVAPARKVIPSYEAAERMYNAGLLQAGPDGCCLVAADDVWYEPELDTFAGDSVAARNAVATLLGNLALLAPQGGRGLPIGHVVAYKASPELQLQFIRAMAAKCGEWGHAPVSD